jgi:chemotaxis signal transduction protein
VSERDALAGRADALRRSFDASFAAPAGTAERAAEQLLAITIGDAGQAFWLADIAAIVVDRAITRLTGPVPELLGIIGLRGSLIPVFDLPALLGAVDRGPRRWLVVTAGVPRVGLAFARFDGHLRVPHTAIAVDPTSGGQIVDAGGVARPIVRVAALVALLAGRGGVEPAP